LFKISGSQLISRSEEEDLSKQTIIDISCKY